MLGVRVGELVSGVVLMIVWLMCPCCRTQTVRFTQEPGNTTYALYGRNATFDWRFEILNQASLSGILWEVKNELGAWIGLLAYQAGTTLKPQNQPKAYEGRLYGNGDGTLVISNLTLEDSGEYRCQLITATFRPTSPTKLVVAEPPNAYMEKKCFCCEKGKSTKAICNATGTPPPSFDWFKKGSTIGLVSGAKYEIVTSGSSSELRMKSCTDEDLDVYTCKAYIGPLEPSSVDFFVGVPTLQEKTDLCPATTYQATVGKPITICCPVYGFPRLYVTWKLSNGSVVETEEAKIIIIPKEKRDFGTYNCTARNPLIDMVKGPFMITLTPDKEAESFEVIKEGNNILMWKGIPNVTDYVVRLFSETGEVISIISQQPKVEILRSSLKSKSGKPFPRKVSFNVTVLALKGKEVTGIGYRDKFDPSGAVLPRINLRTFLGLLIVVCCI